VSRHRSDRSALSVAGYRFRTTLRRRLSGYLAIVFLVGIVGGTAMASIATARRTQSSYPTFLSSTSPSNLGVSVYQPNGGSGTTLTKDIARLPGVTRVRTVIAPAIVPLSANGSPRFDTLNSVVTLGSLDGEFIRQDRLAATQGRVADPARPNEITMTATAARIFGVHVGQAVPLGFYPPA
jgi:hypothetical protein